MVYNSTMEKDRLVLGQEFIRLYDLSMNFGQQKIGFHGFTTAAPKDGKPDNGGDDQDGKNGKGLGILIGVGAAALILIILGVVVSKLRRSKLQKELEHEGEERLV